MRKALFIMGLAALVVVLAGCAQKSQQQNPAQSTAISASDEPPKQRELSQQEIESGNFRRLEIKISGMSCPYCAKGISEALMSEDGIVSTDITLEKRGGSVTYDSTKISKEEILNSPVFEGVYKATLVDDQPIRKD